MKTEMRKLDRGSLWVYCKDDPLKHFGLAVLYVALRQTTDNGRRMPGLSDAALNVIKEVPDLSTLAQYIAIGPFSPMRIPRIDLRHVEMKTDAKGTLAHILDATPPLDLVNNLLNAPLRNDPKAYWTFVGRINQSLAAKGKTLPKKELQTLRFRCLMYHFYRTVLYLFVSCEICGLRLVGQDLKFWTGFEDRIIKPVWLLQTMGPGYILRAGDIETANIKKILKNFRFDEAAHAWLWYMAGLSAEAFTVSPAFNDVVETIGERFAKNERPVLADCFPSPEHTLQGDIPKCFKGTFYAHHHAAACILMRLPKEVIQFFLGITDEEYYELLKSLKSVHPRFVKKPVICPPFVDSENRRQMMKKLTEAGSPLAQLPDANAKIVRRRTSFNRLHTLCILVYVAQRVPCIFLAADKHYLKLIHISLSRELKMFNSLRARQWRFTELDESIMKLPLKELQALYKALMSSDGRNQALIKKHVSGPVSFELIEGVGSLLNARRIGMFAGFDEGDIDESDMSGSKNN
jgi:hypothetical protein